MTDDAPDPIEARLVTQATSLLDVHDDVSRVLKNLDLPAEEFHDRYNITTSKTFEFDPMVRLYLYMRITGLGQEDVTDRVANWPHLQVRFGFDRTPRQQSLSYTKRTRFSLALRQLLDDVAEAIREAAQERDIHSKHLKEPETPSPDEVQQSTIPIHHYVDDHAPDIMSATLNEICPALDTGRRHNVVHPDRSVWEHQLLMSLNDRAGTPSAFRTFNKFRGNALHHDTHVRAVKKLGKPSSYQYTFDDFTSGDQLVPEWRQITNTITPQFNDAVENLISLIEPTAEFSKPFIAAIDTVRVPVSVTPYKGEDDVEPDDEPVIVDKETGATRVPKDDYPEMINGRKGKNYAYEYATLTIVGRNAPIVLAVEPVRHDSTWEGGSGESVSWAETVDRLMDQATDIVDIDLVMADREFDQHGVYHVLDQYHDVDYLIPKKQNSSGLREDTNVVRYDPTLKSRVRPASLYLRKGTPYIDLERDDTVDADNYSHDVNFMFVPAEKDDWIVKKASDVNYTAFATNREDISAEEALRLTDRYSKRWDIENEYKTIKPLTPSIASKDYRMRYFSFVFNCLLYNLWRLTDHALKTLTSEAYDDYGRLPLDDRLPPLLTMPDFLSSSFILMFRRRGLDPPD
ncbi:hypothetical protein GCM10028857_26220 [Salinarchaeum chitinilyticum]